jgi:hypothetical protein
LEAARASTYLREELREDLWKEVPIVDDMPDDAS